MMMKTRAFDVGAWHESALALAKVILAQRTQVSAKLREKIAAKCQQTHAAAKPPHLQRWPHVRDVKELFQLPPYSRQKATDVKELLREYHFCTDTMKLIQIEAERVARATWLAVRGESITGRTVRRWLNRERCYGGPHRAPVKTYADARSCPHRASTRK
jgi:hypothetical protein